MSIIRTVNLTEFWRTAFDKMYSKLRKCTVSCFEALSRKIQKRFTCSDQCSYVHWHVYYMYSEFFTILTDIFWEKLQKSSIFLRCQIRIQQGFYSGVWAGWGVKMKFKYKLRRQRWTCEHGHVGLALGHTFLFAWQASKPTYCTFSPKLLVRILSDSLYL